MGANVPLTELLHYFSLHHIAADVCKCPFYRTFTLFLLKANNEDAKSGNQVSRIQDPGPEFATKSRNRDLTSRIGDQVSRIQDPGRELAIIRREIAIQVAKSRFKSRIGDSSRELAIFRDLRREISRRSTTSPIRDVHFGR